MGEQSVSVSLKEAINNIIKRENYSTYELNINNVALDGGNFLATLTKADIKGKVADVNKEINLFIKNVIKGDLITYLSVSNIHNRELLAHNEFLKIYTKLQEEAQIPLEERYETVKCYEESTSDFIILDNLQKKGFTTVNRLEPVTLHYAETAVKQLAKFHALSFVLKKRMPEYFNEKIKPLRVVMDYDDENWQKLVRNTSYVTINSLHDENIKKKLVDVIPRIIKKTPEYYLDTTTGILCHGDYRTTNLMVKINNGEITNFIAIDYQFMHYGNPLNDLMFFIFTGTDQQFRKNHLEYIKNLYHDTLGTFLKYFNMDVENLYPRKDYEKLYRNRIESGLLIAVWVLPFVFASEEDAPVFSKESPSEIQFNVNKNIKERCMGIVEDFIEWGYL
ncbi:uncharacterized protein LOC113520077 [Galleria mellonella]|uniref:Uncharacterized protein LOC113520077 n=1 Tax=Galleria mellonella TaxID=7137 RepID=A0A6J1WXX3_GALME|nr:uncharacterized protein LOC113520077 [Galleria mellonella]